MTLLMMKTNKKKYKDHLQEYCDNIIYKQPFSPKVKVADLNVYAFSLLMGADRNMYTYSF